MKSLIFKTAEQRVHFLLKELAEEHGRHLITDPDERVIEMRLTHEEIAKLSATKCQTVTAV